MRTLVVLALVASCKDAPPKPRPLVTVDPLVTLDAAPRWPAEKPDDGLAERPGPESEVVWLDRLVRHVEGLASKLGGDVDCARAAGFITDAFPEALELSHEVHGLARAAAAGQLAPYAKRIEAGFARLKQVFARCSTSPGFVATLGTYPFDPTRVPAPPPTPTPTPTGERPAVVTDEVVALADQLAAIIDRMATGLAATGGDCARGTALLKSMRADRAIEKVAKRFAELSTNTEVMTWFQTHQMKRLMPPSPRCRRSW